MSVRPADFGDRVGAAMIDFGVRIGVILTGAAIGAIGFASSTALGIVLVIVLGGTGLLASYAYAPLMMSRTNGLTLGHRAVGTRIVRKNGEPMDLGSAFVREVLVKALLLDLAGTVILLVPTIVNYAYPLFDDDNEALHDKLCGTRVVEDAALR